MSNKESIQEQKATTGHKPNQSLKRKPQSKVTELQTKLEEAEAEATLVELASCIASVTQPPPTNNRPTGTTSKVDPAIAAFLRLRFILKPKGSEV